MGAARSNITAQVVAGIPLQSHITPASMAPAIPPISKHVDKSADLVGLNDAEIN